MIGGRPYQEEAARRDLPRLWRDHRAVMIVSPVGSGKTRMMAMVAEERRRKGVADFLATGHRRVIVRHLLRSFRDLGLPATRLGEEPEDDGPLVLAAGIGELADPAFRPRRDVLVLSLDEAHLAAADTWRTIPDRLAAMYREVRVVLWTATPGRLDGRPLGDVAGVLHEATTPPELFDEGWLVEPTVLAAAEPDLEGVPMRGGDYVPEALAERTGGTKLRGEVVRSWKAHAEGRPSVLFAASRADSMYFEDAFRRAGVRARHVDGNTRDLDAVLAGLAVGGTASGHPRALDVVCCADLLTTGWDPAGDYLLVADDPRGWWLGRSFPPPRSPLQVMLDCKPTASVVLYRQEEGRITRPEEGKGWARVISLSGNWRRLGFLRHYHGFALDTGGNACGNAPAGRKGGGGYSALHCSCLAVWPPGTPSCAHCGAPLREDPPPPEEEEAELEEVGPERAPPPAPDPAAERSFLRSLWAGWYRRNDRRAGEGKRPIKPGQVARLFFAKFGRWPPSAVSWAEKREVASRRRNP